MYIVNKNNHPNSVCLRICVRFASVQIFASRDNKWGLANIINDIIYYKYYNK